VADRYSEAPVGADGFLFGSTKRVGGFPAESRERPPPTSPGGEKPKGASGGRHANHTLDRKGLSEGSKPSNRSPSAWLAAPAAGIPLGETVSGSA